MWKIVLDALFPLTCVVCGTEGHRWCRAGAMPWPFCFRCRGPHHVEPRGEHCRRSLPVVTIGPYADLVLRRLIHDWKYRGQWAISEGWAAELGQRVDDFELAPLAPVPLHWRRTLMRGYNQSEVLARQIGRAIDQPVLSAIRRVRHTKPQVSTPAELRAENVAGAFQLTGTLPPRIWLVDDVVTTGATLRELCTLARSRTEVVGILALAHAQPGQDSIERLDESAD